MANQYDGALRAAILEAIKRPNGMVTSDIDGFTIKQVGRMTQKLQTAHLVFRAPTGGKFGRYFDTITRAEAYANSFKGKPVAGVKIGKTAPWPDDTPVNLPKGIKIQRSDAPPPRFAAAPGEVVCSVINSEQARPWAMAATA